MPNPAQQPFDHSMPQKMHALYNELTGYSIEFQESRRYPWELFCLRFAPDELRLVVRWIQKREREGKPHRSLSFRSFISGPGSLDYFEEDLAEARREINIAKKPHPNPARESVLRATGRESGTAKERTAEQILAETEALERLRRWRENL